jgi:hypothetical protein
MGPQLLAAPQWLPSITASSLKYLSGHEGAEDGVLAMHGRFSARVMHPLYHLPTKQATLSMVSISPLPKYTEPPTSGRSLHSILWSEVQVLGLGQQFIADRSLME